MERAGQWFWRKGDSENTSCKIRRYFNMGNSTVFANGQGLTNKGSGAVVVSGPDVCLTPMGNSVVPIPYTNTARSSALADGTTSVKVDGNMAAAGLAALASRRTGERAGPPGLTREMIPSAPKITSDRG